MSNKLVIITAPSGAGKTTIVKYLLEELDNFEFSVSATTRAPRPHEIEGEAYYFMSIHQFHEKVKLNEFVEWEEVYPDQFYGTLHTEIERIWQNDHSVLFDIDVRGARNLKNFYKEKAISIFIMPPSLEVLAERLKSRNTESKESLDLRLGKATKEINDAHYFDHIVINDDLDLAKKNAIDLVKNFILSEQ